MKVKTGIYEHFKAKRYEVLGVAKHGETFEAPAFYRALYGKLEWRAWPLQCFWRKWSLRERRSQGLNMSVK